jgi:hypothetical protein
VAAEARIFGLNERIETELAVRPSTFAGIEEIFCDVIQQLFDRRPHGQKIFRNG